MSNNKSTLVPEAREALNRFKMEAASEVDVADTSKTLVFNNLKMDCGTLILAHV